MIFSNKNNQMIKQFQNTLDTHEKQIKYIKQGIQEELKDIHSQEIKPTMVQKCILVLMELTKLKQSVNQFKSTINSYQDIKNEMNKQINRLEAEYENYMVQIKENFEKIEKNMEENGAFKNLQQLKIFEIIKIKDDQISKLSKRVQYLQVEDQKLRNKLTQETQKFNQIKQQLQQEIQYLKKNNFNTPPKAQQNNFNTPPKAQQNNLMITQQFKQDSECKFKFTDEGQECIIIWDEKSCEKQSTIKKKSLLENINLREITQQEDQQGIQVYNIKQVPSKSLIQENIIDEKQIQSHFQYKQNYNSLSARQLNSYEQQSQVSFRIDTQIQQKINKFVNSIASTQKGILKQKFENKVIISKSNQKPQSSRLSRCSITQNSKEVLSKQFKTALKQFKLKKQSNHSFFK